MKLNKLKSWVIHENLSLPAYLWYLASSTSVASLPSWQGQGLPNKAPATSSGDAQSEQLDAELQSTHSSLR